MADLQFLRLPSLLKEVKDPVMPPVSGRSFPHKAILNQGANLEESGSCASA
jgi:hypothetical protein